LKSTFIILSILFTISNIGYCQQTRNQDSIPIKPSVSWGEFPPGRMKADTFKKQTQLNIPKGYILKKAIINFMFPVSGSHVEKFNLYSQDLSQIKEALNRCVPGTIVYIEKIFTVDQNGQNTFLRNAGFLLY